MPNFFKLKKSKQQYNVASKSVYVITVELLDNTLLECTLTSESTGRDCMDNVCQRLGLQQPDLFGLRYVSRRSYPKIRWADLDRPLKKQLDKYAQEPYLYLAVMFYVHDVSLLGDEVTRYHYFLQLKLDVIEGRLRCNYEQAIVLASYSLQAEFGDHDPEKHTLDYLQDFPLLPKPILSQFPEDKIGTLTDAIITQHANLRGIAQQLAEVYYIVGAQQLDGYGQECFLAKDERGNEVLIGASLTGIVVRKGNVLQPLFFKWYDITNLVNHKRVFGIECQNYELSVQFLLDEPDSAKYVWKICVLQHTFYKMHANASESSELSITLQNSRQPTPFQASQPTQSRGNPFFLNGEQNYPATIQHSEIQNFHQQTQKVDLTPIKFKRPLGLNLGSQAQTVQTKAILEQSTADYANNTTLQQSYNNYVLSNSAMNVNEVPTSQQSQPLSQQVANYSNLMTDSHAHFRPAPDYETAIRNKYGVFANNILGGQQPAQIYNSQPSLITDALYSHGQAHRGNNLPPSTLVNAHHHLNLHHVNEQESSNHPSAYSSTPELNRMNLNHQVHATNYSNIQDQNQLVAELQRLNIYRPPPPYPGPYAKLASTSTPDLAGLNSSGGVVGLSGSSPDLVSRRNLGVAATQQVHRTFENLMDITKLAASSNNLANGQPTDYRHAYSTEELHSSVAYRLDSTAHVNNNNEAKSHLVHEVLPNNYLATYARAVPNGNQQYDPNRVATVAPQVQGNVNDTDSAEPIYQNQQQLLIQQHNIDLSEEPIYQNLPAHERLMYKQRILEQLQREQQLQLEALDSSDSIHVDDTVDSADPLQNTLQNHQSSSVDPIIGHKIKGHVSRVAITNSRENLNLTNTDFYSSAASTSVTQIQNESKNEGSEVDQITASHRLASTPPKPKRSVTKINIGSDSNSSQSQRKSFKASANEGNESESPEVFAPIADKKAQPGTRLSNPVSEPSSTNAALKNTVAKASNPVSSGRPKSSYLHPGLIDSPMKRSRSKPNVSSNYFDSDPFMMDPPNTSKPNNPRTPSSKPRAGRKRWALNFGNKTGSLKSVKSEGGHSHKSQGSFDGSVKSNSGGGFGPMMLATLHGLTRSRPDLLAESMATFSQPSKMPKDEIGAYLESKIDEGEVLREFERIPKKKHTNCNFVVAMTAENIPRNRFTDVLPYDENRVKLSSVDKDNKAGYINASHVSATVGPDQRFYIAAQGPLPNTLLHFWQMILQSDVHLIVMLTDVTASHKSSSCIPYWPQKNGSTLEVGDFKIVKKFSNESGQGSYTTSTLHVTHIPSKTQRTIWHLQYSDWADHGCPTDVRTYIEFMEEIAALRQHTVTEIPVGKNRNPPILVHCSAGVGRTGVTILCDILLYCVDHNLDIDIPKVLTHLRQQRMLMVQTIAQYKFVHTVLIHYLKQSRLI